MPKGELSRDPGEPLTAVGSCERGPPASELLLRLLVRMCLIEGAVRISQCLGKVSLCWTVICFHVSLRLSIRLQDQLQSKNQQMSIQQMSMLLCSSDSAITWSIYLTSIRYKLAQAIASHAAAASEICPVILGDLLQLQKSAQSYSETGCCCCCCCGWEALQPLFGVSNSNRSSS